MDIWQAITEKESHCQNPKCQVPGPKPPETPEQGTLAYRCGRLVYVTLDENPPGFTWTAWLCAHWAQKAAFSSLSPHWLAYPEQKCSNWINRDVEPSACDLHDTCIHHLHPSSLSLFPIRYNNRSASTFTFHLLYHSSHSFIHPTHSVNTATYKNTQAHQRACFGSSYFHFPSAGDTGMTHGTWLKPM